MVILGLGTSSFILVTGRPSWDLPGVISHTSSRAHIIVAWGKNNWVGYCENIGYVVETNLCCL